MRFVFSCRRCGSALEASSDQSGRSGKCPTCGGLFTIPHADRETGVATTVAGNVDDQLPTPMHAYATAGSQAPKIRRTATGEQVIGCPRCGRDATVDANTCPFCGLPFTMEGATEAIANTETGGLGRRAMFIGVVSIVLLCIPVLPGIAAIIVGILAWRKIPQQDQSAQRAMAATGVVLGLISLTVSTILLVWKYL